MGVNLYFIMLCDLLLAFYWGNVDSNRISNGGVVQSSTDPQQQLKFITLEVSSGVSVLGL